MNYYSQQPTWRPMFNKRAVAILTPEAMQAAMQPPPPDPSMMGGAPMDPAMAGGQPPMDPSMMGGAPMPPQGAPPMDPSMGGISPAGGLPPEAMQDQLFIQFLAEAFGIMMDPRSGQFFDQNGQPVPPEVLMQAYQAYMQGMQQLQAQGMMDPSMGGMPPQGGAPMPPQGAPPMDPAAMGGAPMPPPMDPSMMGGQPPMPPQGGMPPADPMTGAMPGGPGMPTSEGGEQPMDAMMADFASMITTVMEDAVVTPLKEGLANIQKQFADLKEMMKTMRDDMGTIRTDVDAQESRADEDSMLRSEIAAELEPTLPEEPQVEKTASAKSELRPLNILDILGSK